MKYGKKIYTINLTELENKNFVNAGNMQFESLKNFNVKNHLFNFIEENNVKLDNIFDNL